LEEPLPGKADLEWCLELTKMGDIVALRKAVSEMRYRDPLLVLFCERLEILGNNYRMEALERILRKAVDSRG
jgi:hypothetical protein